MSISNLETPNDLNLFAGSISFGIDDDQEPFSVYRNAGYAGTASGPYASPITVPGLQRQLDTIYVFTVAGFSGTATSSNPITFSTALGIPIPFLIWTDLYFPIWVINNSAEVAGTLKIDTSGVITMYVDFNTAFTGSGTCGTPGFSISFASYKSP